jgi:hypothetical protein
LARAVTISFGLAVALLSHHHARAAMLGEAELRSWLGEPLQVRVSISAAADEEIDASCFSVSRDSQPIGVLRDARTELVESGREKRFLIRTFSAVNEPFVRLVVRYACVGQGASLREYTLLLDPRPETTAPSIAFASTQVVGPSTAVAAPTAPSSGGGQSGQWVVGRADTLEAIAEGVYPRSIKRKARYIAALRTLNPQLAALPDNATLPPGTLLTLPDLRALSSPSRRVVPAGVAVPIATKPPADTRQPSPPPPARADRPARTATPNGAPSSAGADPQTATPPQRNPTLAPTSARRAPAQSSAEGKRFTLKLSGTDIDTSRSAGISEEQRTLLREKQFLLDADDQLAQFLALKNAVKQLENRLNIVQSQLGAAPASATSASSSPTNPAGAPSALAPEVSATNSASGTIGAAGTPPAQPTGPAAAAAQQASANAPPAYTTTSAPTAVRSGGAASLINTLTLLTAVAAALVLGVAAYVWWRRRNEMVASEPPLDLSALTVPPTTASATLASEISDAEQRSERDKQLAEADRQAADDELTLALRASARAAAAPVRSDAPTISLSSPSDLAAPASEGNRVTPSPPLPKLTLPAFDPGATVQLAESPAHSAHDPAAPRAADGDDEIRFDLYDGPLLAVDFPIEATTDAFAAVETFALPRDDGAQKQDEERVRRMQYIHERFPELHLNTLSLDDSDSIIDAARDLIDELSSPETSQVGKADLLRATRARELLTFAHEERPQEMRYWLALFEVLRIEQRADVFGDIAQKFEILFGQSPEWSEVKRIGRELDPSNALYRERAGDTLIMGEIDSSAWLNAARGIQQQVRATALRAALTEEHP